MKKIIVLISLVFAQATFARGPEKVLQAVTEFQSVNPSMVTSFNDKSLSDSYVTVVTSLIGGAWQSQSVYISLGSPEDPQTVFEFNIMGDFTSIDYNETPDSLVITAKTNVGPWNQDLGSFDNGSTTYTITIGKDASVESGYANSATLSSEAVSTGTIVD